MLKYSKNLSIVTYLWCKLGFLSPCIYSLLSELQGISQGTQTSSLLTLWLEQSQHEIQTSANQTSPFPLHRDFFKKWPRTFIQINGGKEKLFLPPVFNFRFDAGVTVAILPQQGLTPEVPKATMWSLRIIRRQWYAKQSKDRTQILLPLFEH